MRAEKVEVYQVNGHLVCAKTEKDLEEYLSDVPTLFKFGKTYEGTKHIVALGNEFKTNKCKELNHLKINMLFNTSKEIDDWIEEKQGKEIKI